MSYAPGMACECKAWCSGSNGMILPYLATALLILVTAYAALVTFRPRPEGAAPSWIFPRGVNRPARMIVGLCTLAVVIGLVAWLSTGTHESRRPSSRFLIPEGYVGWVRVEFEVQGASALPLEAGQAVLKIPPDGLLRTSSPEQYGWAKDYYFYYAESVLRPLADSGPSRMIWGKINGEASGSSSNQKYQEFFVGTERQFKEQAGEKTVSPKPQVPH